MQHRLQRGLAFGEVLNGTPQPSMKVYKAVTLGIVVAFRVEAQATWVVLPSPSPSHTLLVDTASITTIGSNTFGAFRWTGLYAGDTTSEGKRFAYVERARIADCRTGKLAIEEVSYYAPEDT